MRHINYAFLLIGLFAGIADAHAYIGPGPGLSMLGSLFTLLGGVALALLMVLMYPIRLLMKRKKANKKPE